MKRIILMLLLLVVLTGCNKVKNEPSDVSDQKEQIIEITAPNVIENKTYGNILIKDITFNYDGKYSNMGLTIINNGEESITIGNFDVIVKNKSGEEIGRFNGYYANPIESKEELVMELSLDKDFKDTDSVEFDFNY